MIYSDQDQDIILPPYWVAGAAAGWGLVWADQMV